MIDLKKVTRIEVIEDGKRKYVSWHADKAVFMLQDGGRTLKIFMYGVKGYDKNN